MEMFMCSDVNNGKGMGRRTEGIGLYHLIT